MSKLDFSILIPTCNRKEILEETLNRIFDQDFDKKRYEVIIVDDGSVDDTQGFLSSLNLSVEFVHISHPQNYGRARSRNSAIKKARGKIVLMIDDDIWVEKDFLKKHYEAHNSYKENVVVTGASLPSPNVPNTIWNRFFSDRYLKITDRMRKSSHDLSYEYFRTGNVSLKKEVLEKIGFFDECFCVYGSEDTDMGRRLKQQGYRLIYKEIIGKHYFEADLQSILAKAYQRGCSACLLVQKHPELWKDLQFHSVFYKNSPLWKNILKAVLYSEIAINLNKLFVQILSKIKSNEKLLIYLLGILEWQYYVKGVREYGKNF